MIEQTQQPLKLPEGRALNQQYIYDLIQESKFEFFELYDAINTIPFLNNYGKDALGVPLYRLVAAQEVRPYLLKLIPIILQGERILNKSFINAEKLFDAKGAAAFLDHNDRQGYFLRLCNIVISLVAQAGTIAHKMHTSELSFATASAFLGTELSGRVYKHTLDEELKDIAFAYAVYFSYIHDMLVGARTTATIFSRNPDIYPVDILNRAMPVVLEQDKESLKKTVTSVLFGGGSISPIQETDQGAFSIMHL